MQDIQAQRKEIYEEIHEIRNSVNTHLDKLQETLIGSIHGRLWTGQNESSFSSWSSQ
jgi:uncharacterized coiled-coil DUF342 family protein